MPDHRWLDDLGLRTVTPDELADVPLATDVVQVSLYRDFMPICPPDGRPMMVVVRPRAADVTVDRVAVVNGQEVWVAQPEDSGGGATARNGPKWEPGETVDVVVRLRSGESAHVLRLDGQRIQSTA